MRIFVARLKSDGQTNAKKVSHMNKLANVIRDLNYSYFEKGRRKKCARDNSEGQYGI